MSSPYAPTGQLLCAPWATHVDVPASQSGNPEPIPEPVLDRWLTVASEILFTLSGSRWRGGPCETTVTLHAAPAPGVYPYHGSWGHCGCHAGWQNGAWPLWLPNWVGRHHAPMAVGLPHDDVTEVTEVTVNGDPFTDWVITRPGWLGRTDGLGWVVCGDTTTVTYSHGRPPPAGGVQAVILLGVELALGATGNPSCALPVRWQSITREGMTITALDGREFLDSGLTGLTPVDLWLRSVNPQGRTRRGIVWSPDLPATTRSLT